MNDLNMPLIAYFLFFSALNILLAQGFCLIISLSGKSTLCVI